MRLIITSLFLCLLSISPVWAYSVFDLGVINPTASQLVHYPEIQGQQNGLAADFKFTIATGNSIQIDFQGYPSTGTGFSSVEYVLRDNNFFNLSMEFLILDSNYFWTETITGLNIGTDYALNIYGWGDPMGGGDGGDYRITLTAEQDGGAAPVPEPSTVLLLGGGLGGIAFWRRKTAKK